MLRNKVLEYTVNCCFCSKHAFDNGSSLLLLKVRDICLGLYLFVSVVLHFVSHDIYRTIYETKFCFPEKRILDETGVWINIFLFPP